MATATTTASYTPRHLSPAAPTGLQAVREMRAALTARGRAGAVILRGKHRAYDAWTPQPVETGTEAA